MSSLLSCFRALCSCAQNQKVLLGFRPNVRRLAILNVIDLQFKGLIALSHEVTRYTSYVHSLGCQICLSDLGWEIAFHTQVSFAGTLGMPF